MCVEGKPRRRAGAARTCGAKGIRYAKQPRCTAQKKRQRVTEGSGEGRQRAEALPRKIRLIQHRQTQPITNRRRYLPTFRQVASPAAQTCETRTAEQR